MNKFLLLALAAPLAGAALPPDVIEAANANAKEKLYISVLSVEDQAMSESESCWAPVHANAKVVEVEASASGKMPGDIIHFSSREWDYGDEGHDDHMEEDGMGNHTGDMLGDSMSNATAEMRNGHNATEEGSMNLCAMGPPPGPRPPPELYPGWCGWVYFNLDDTGHMVMAIDGNSYVPAEDMSTCPPVEGEEVHEDDHDNHDHDGDGVQDHASEDHEDGHDDHDHDGDGVQDHASEDHVEEEDDHDHDHDHDDEGGEKGDPATCGEPCSTQGSCEAGQVNVCHGGDTDECIPADEWSSHCSDFGDTCGACEVSSASRHSLGVAAIAIVFMVF